MCSTVVRVGIDLKSAYITGTRAYYNVRVCGRVLNAAVRENPIKTDGRKIMEKNNNNNKKHHAYTRSHKCKTFKHNAYNNNVIYPIAWLGDDRIFSRSPAPTLL